MTSGIAKAILAAAANRPYEIKFDGPVALQYADDAARIFIGAARAEYAGAVVCNMRNDVVTVSDFLKALQVEIPGHQVAYTAGNFLPYPADLDDSGLRLILGDIPHTPLPAAIRATLEIFTPLINENRLDLSQLDS
jgi:nucleoside-diphosphate-sugar epimerase